MLDQAFEALKTYDWGAEPKTLEPIDEAVVATRDDAAARQELEARLVAVLKTGAPRAAKDFVCRKLQAIGTAASVPALAELLPDKALSHMARYALERIPAPEAAQAMRDALPKLDNALKVGVMGSLGVRQDAASVPALAALLGAADATVARSSALALGAIRDPESVRALQEAKPESDEVKPPSWTLCWVVPKACWQPAKKAKRWRYSRHLPVKTSPNTFAWRRLAACWPARVRATERLGNAIRRPSKGGLRVSRFGGWQNADLVYNRGAGESRRRRSGSPGTAARLGEPCYERSTARSVPVTQGTIFPHDGS